jgi:hypothetical protein
MAARATGATATAAVARPVLAQTTGDGRDDRTNDVINDRDDRNDRNNRNHCINDGIDDRDDGDDRNDRDDGHVPDGTVRTD